jgi:hypothetical protein
VVQRLIDDGLVTITSRFVLTAKGREYLENPLRWRIDSRAAEDAERVAFWDAIYNVFDRATRRLRAGASSER